MEKRLIDKQFIRNPPLRGDGKEVFIKLLPFRIPKKPVETVDPKDRRWLDDDELTAMETAVYNDTLY